MHKRHRLSDIYQVKIASVSFKNPRQSILLSCGIKSGSGHNRRLFRRDTTLSYVDTPAGNVFPLPVRTNNRRQRIKGFPDSLIYGGYTFVASNCDQRRQGVVVLLDLSLNLELVLHARLHLMTGSARK